VNSVVVLQARTNSSRLPGKVLLPLNGVPLVVLAAKRAANTGREVIVATSDHGYDDGLARLLEHAGLPFFRGSLDNTLARVVGALARFKDDTIVFRLTADNVVPDGQLLDEIEADFLERGLDYLSCNGLPSGLPYGMSAEVTRLAHLREAAQLSTSTYDQEHVTPYVARKFGVTVFERHKALGLGALRCTIDCFDDYMTMQQVFAGVDDPVAAPSALLLQRLAAASYQPATPLPLPVSRLVMGTVQLGTAYGIANTTGVPALAASKELLKTAICHGVAWLDTARAYGRSEQVIGALLKDGWQARVKVITKLSPLAECPPDAPRAVVRAFVDASVWQSCAMLGVQAIDVLMLHRAEHIDAWQGAAWERLREHRAAGLIGALGASVQSPQELLAVLDCADVAFIQMPFNLLDWRWDAAIARLEAVRRERALTVHVRSALLQGLLPSADPALWRRAHVPDCAEVVGWLAEQATLCGRLNVADLCLNYVNALPWVDGIATGMESLAQLSENIALFTRAPLTAAELARIAASRPRLSESTLNPALWEK
jgi:aryl-alcohol dehydrogenase-like predicted oxidoreductase/spore coat polysaccharide biosynthesis protein SpsF (cytidylyltransferase family)